MKFVLFYHSLISDWNHGNAHFLRGVATELIRQGHEVQIYEPADGWSMKNLLAEYGDGAVERFHSAYPGLTSHRYDRLDPKRALAGADVAIVHEWNETELVRAIGAARPKSCVTFFHDTHHRAVTRPEFCSTYDFAGYDGVLAYGRALAELYRQRAPERMVWTWHEAADTRVFHPRNTGRAEREGDLVWIGNWGDGERTAELEEFLIQPVERLRLRASVYGVRYPKAALQRLARAGIKYCGWLPNFAVPEIFAQFKVTVHIPRGPYVSRLKGIPTIRPFEAMACGIPLVCSPWEDTEGMFSAGKDYLVARDGGEMTSHLERVLADPEEASGLARRGLRAIESRHTCRHRVEELMKIYQEAKRTR